MSRLFTRILLVSLVAVTCALVTPGAQRPVEAQVKINSDIAEIDAIHRIYEDFIGRRATRAELDRFTPRLGVGQIENDVRVRVLASRAFFVGPAGTSREGFVVASYEEVLGRAPTASELTTSKRQLFRSKLSLLKARQGFVERLLDRANYDPDDFGIRELVLHQNSNGDIVRFAFELEKPITKNDSVELTVAIRGNQLRGTTRVRAFENIVSFVPDTPMPRSGKIVGLVFFDDGGVSRIADLSTPALRLPPRTTDFAQWPARVFENQRIVAYYGNHLTSLLGVLGETGPEGAVTRVKAAAARFNEPGKPAVGAFEMIVTVAQGSAGADGNYSHPSKLADVARWVDIAEREGLYVILDIQPGRSDFLTESKRYESLLKRPNVGIALDPEWRMGPFERPGQSVGSVTAAEINQVSAWLSNLVIENDLPEKMFILHQFQSRMIKNRDQLVDRPGLATVIHADGFGGRAIKQHTYSIIKVGPPFYNGFKLFIDEDTRIFQPREVLAFTSNPVPDLITYQ
ncbi:MAG: hypothetical protein ACI81L_002624 [Verrucomicrobiales bacterium]|jgi:hypothetical protein